MVGPLRAPYLSTTTKRLTSKRLGARARGSSADPRGAADVRQLDKFEVSKARGSLLARSWQEVPWPMCSIATGVGPAWDCNGCHYS